MKKIFFSLVALAALAACTKSEVQYEQTGEIALAPVTSNATKSVAGYNGDTFDGIFPTGIDLYVFANAGAPGSNAGAHTEPYFRNAQFEWFTTAEKPNATNTTADGGAYAGNPTRYWPNVKTLVFAGYSDACGLSKTTPTMDFTNNVLTIPTYTQDNSVTYMEEGVNDLMWFARSEPYSKQANEIVVEMQHACSWITINILGDDVTANKWKLNSLLVKNIAHTGNADCGETEAAWDELSDYSDEYYYNGETTFATSGKEYATATKTTVTEGENPSTTTEYIQTSNNFIVIPQTPTSLDVTYTYTSQEAVGTPGAEGYQAAITLTETKNIPLKYTAEGSENTNWQSGVHYIYNVKITATEILIDPVVVEWTESSGHNIDTDYEESEEDAPTTGGDENEEDDNTTNA